MTSWSSLDMEHAHDSHHHLPSTSREVPPTLRNELGQIFHDNKLDLLANASDIGFSEVTRAATQTSTAEKDGSQRFGDSDMSLLKPEHKIEYISSSDMFGNNNCSPANPAKYKGENLHSLISGHGSPSLFLDRGEMESKENYFYPYHLRSDQNDLKIFADYEGNQNFFNDYKDESLSLMWNEDQNNSLPKSKEVKLDFEDSDYHDEDTVAMHDFKIRHSPYSKLEDDLSRLFVRKTNSCKSMNMNMPESYESTLDTHPTISMDKALRPHTVDYSAVFKRKKNGYPDFDEFEDPYNDMKGRSSRGLRVLSLRVKDVVRMKNKTSYKEVADFLTQEVSQRMKAHSQEEARDDQNVKRRVYDALNVLIAADILKKDGKVVFCGENIDSIGINRKRRLAYELDKLKKKTAKVQKKIKTKERKLQELLFKALAVQNLLKRNKETHNLIPIGSGQRENGSKEDNKIQVKKEPQATTNGKVDVEEEKTVKFPFIMIPSLAEDSMNVRMNRAKTNVLVESKIALNIHGDTDILLKMKMHYVSKELFSQVLIKDMHKYVPQVYLDTLK